MKKFKVVVYNSVSRAKYTYQGSFASIEEAISYYQRSSQSSGSQRDGVALVNRPTRPFRNYSVYAAACVDCGEEVESRELPVPLRCPSCQAKRDKEMLKDRPSPVRSTSGG